LKVPVYIRIDLIDQLDEIHCNCGIFFQSPLCELKIKIDDYGSLNLFSLSFDSGPLFVRIPDPTVGQALWWRSVGISKSTSHVRSGSSSMCR